MRSSDWQPMETAPLNPYGKAYGPNILIWCAADNNPVTCYYQPCGGIDNNPRWVCADDGSELGEGDAVAWMPIAAPWPEVKNSDALDGFEA